MKLKSSCLVSVIIPYYKSRLLLYRALRSVSNQTYRPFEIIVVNDDISDDCRILAEHYFPDVIVVDYEGNRGVSYARNQGVRRAKGTFVAFLDTDDHWSPQKLEIQVSLMLASEALFSTTGFWDVRHRATTRWGSRDLSGRLDLLMRRGIPFNTSGVIVERKLFEEAGGFREDLITGEDFSWYFRLSMEGIQACFVGAPIVYVHHDNIASLTSINQPTLSFFQVVNDLLRSGDAPPQVSHSTSRNLSQYFFIRYLRSIGIDQEDMTLRKELLTDGVLRERVLLRLLSLSPKFLRKSLAVLLRLARPYSLQRKLL